jgi:esterase/lipase superfamily enzyme
VLNLDSIDADTLKRAILELLKREVGVTLGVTRDGGALSITLLDNGENIREYVRATEDINLYLSGLADDFGKD